MLRRRRAHKLIDRAQPFAAEPLIAVANFTWVRPDRADLAGGLPDWTLIGVGSARLWIIEADPRRPDTGASLIGSWPLADVTLTERRYPRTVGPVPWGSWRALRLEFPDREPADLQPFGREVNAVMEIVDGFRSK